MDVVTMGLFLAGLAALVVGAEVLVRGAARLAARIGLSPLVIGLTVVAFGTSAPELAVNLRASLTGQPDIAVGNVVGSNIFNVLAVLGASALAAPLVVARRLVRLDVPFMIGVSGFVFALALDGRVGRLEGGLLVAGLVGHTVFLVRQNLAEEAATRAATDPPQGAAEPRRVVAWLGDGALVAGGLALLVLGADWLVEGAVSLARTLGVSELVIALTIVAAGTSLPEAATSLVASLRGERDIAVGNVVGSNVFNLLGILGLSGLVAADGIRVAPAALRFDLPVMMATSLACLPIFFSGYTIARWEGVLFLAYYVAYTSYLVLDAAQHDALPAFSAVMAWFVLPLTAITLLVIAVRAFHLERRARSNVPAAESHSRRAARRTDDDTIERR